MNRWMGCIAAWSAHVNKNAEAGTVSDVLLGCQKRSCHIARYKLGSCPIGVGKSPESTAQQAVSSMPVSSF